MQGGFFEKCITLQAYQDMTPENGVRYAALPHAPQCKLCVCIRG